MISPHSSHGPAQDYAAESDELPPVGAYVALMTIYAGSLATGIWAARRSRKLPSGLRVDDLALLGTATHRLTRIVTRARVTSPLRIPFTRYEGSAGAGEVNEHPRGRGLRQAVGRLLTCPFCAGPWIAGALATTLLFAPRETRFVSGVLAVDAVSDFLHQAWAYARRASA